MVDLEIMDSQSFEYCYTGFVDVEGLTQLCICCTVHPANLKKKSINTEQGNTERHRERLVWNGYLDVVSSEECLEFLVLA